jgi:hypothetical protein
MLVACHDDPETPSICLSLSPLLKVYTSLTPEKHRRKRIRLLDANDLRKARLACQRFAAWTPEATLVLLHTEHAEVEVAGLDAPVWMRQSGVLSAQFSVAHGCDIILTASPWALGIDVLELDADVEPLE